MRRVIGDQAHPVHPARHTHAATMRWLHRFYADAADAMERAVGL